MMIVPPRPVMVSVDRDGVHATAEGRCEIVDAGAIFCEARREISLEPGRSQYFAKPVRHSRVQVARCRRR